MSSPSWHLATSGSIASTLQGTARAAVTTVWTISTVALYVFPLTYSVCFLEEKAASLLYVFRWRNANQPLPEEYIYLYQLAQPLVMSVYDSDQLRFLQVILSREIYRIWHKISVSSSLMAVRYFACWNITCLVYRCKL